MDDLTDIDRRMLDIAGRTYLHWGSREQAVRSELGMSLTRYSQALNALIDRPAALVADPMLVNRLRRAREQARARRRHPAGRGLR